MTESIRRCSIGREAIAEEMARVTGEKVTLRMLNSYTSEAAEQHRFPVQYVRAFCFATSDWTLLRTLAGAAGFHLITEREADLLELGRQTLLRKRADEKTAILEKRLQGVDL